MNLLKNQKIKTTHLSRKAYLYIRQSTLRQVHENQESTKRQYALKQQAVLIGWPLENIIIIDSDLGQSGATSIERSGFQKLVAEVGMGHAGIVISIEVSRLSRSSADWSRLLEICAITDTLIMDEDGIYDTNDFNDRLLLGLKGTMSEAELHFLQARMRGGLINKAKRGELKRTLPSGYIYNDNEQIVFDPDIQVQQAIKLFFKTFQRLGSAWQTIKEFNKQSIKFPLKVQNGFRKGEVRWIQLLYSRSIAILHNPIYAGVYSYGENQTQRTINGKKTINMPREDWYTFIPDSHPCYISLAEYESNLKQLKNNMQIKDDEGRKSPPREGPALLQGIAVCGKCGDRMTTRYHIYGKRLIPLYNCQKRHTAYGEKVCQQVKGDFIDKEISKILVEMVNPLAMEAAMEVQQELNSRKLEVDKFYKQQVERARYEMELARRRYMNVDPDNRLVASELEAQWNMKIKDLDQSQETYEKQCQAEVKVISDNIRTDITDIASKFPEVWNDKNVPNREKKRMVRCLIEDVTIRSDNEITLSIRYKGGTSSILRFPKPLPIWQIWTTRPEIIKEIDYLTSYCTTDEIAAILNERGLKSGKGQDFSSRIVKALILEYEIKGRYKRLRDAGLLTLIEKMKELGLSQKEIQTMRENNLIHFHKFCNGEQYLYEPRKY